MTNAKRGRGSRRGVYISAVAALGLALSACGGGSGSSTATTSQDASSSSGASSSSVASSGTTASPPAASNGSVTINWTPPTENTNGTALTDLAGYDINYGTSSGNYTQTITVSNPGIATYVVDNLTPGTYYFTVTAYNSDGTQSPPSSEVSATVN